MTARLAAIWLALTLLLPGSVFAQVLSEQQLDYLRDQFLEATEGVVDGSVIDVETLPPNRIQGLMPPSKLQAGIPANKIVEADPVALPVAENAVALAQAAQATANSAAATGGTLGGDLSALSSTVSSISNDLDTLELSVGAISNDLDTLELSVGTISNDHDTLELSVGTISNDVDTIQTQLFYTTTYTTNLVIPLVSQTITLYIANGLITNALTEGP
jgi:hypothetical protein